MFRSPGSLFNNAAPSVLVMCSRFTRLHLQTDLNPSATSERSTLRTSDIYKTTLQFLCCDDYGSLRSYRDDDDDDVCLLD